MMPTVCNNKWEGYSFSYSTATCFLLGLSSFGVAWKRRYVLHLELISFLSKCSLKSTDVPFSSFILTMLHSFQQLVIIVQSPRAHIFHFRLHRIYFRYSPGWSALSGVAAEFKELNLSEGGGEKSKWSKLSRVVEDEYFFAPTRPHVLTHACILT